MKLSDVLSLGMTLAGSLAATRLLRRRHAWEQTQRTVAICVDYDDAVDAAIRAALPFDQMLQRLASSGATHLSLPELTLERLLQQGLLVPQAPATPLAAPAPLGHWNYLHGPAHLVERLAREMCERLPYTEARVLQDTTLAFAGNLPALRGIGLGFDEAQATRITAQGLRLVPRPVSYDWPEPALVERTLGQAAQHGKLVAFAGDMILGHEMHLDETVAALGRHDLNLVYFAHSRHQKGDWFVAKRRAPHVVLGHRFTPAKMIPLDYHAAAHNWAHLAREQGIRFCYVNFFRVLHATEPLEGLHYVQHVRQALEEAGFEVAQPVAQSPPAPRAETEELAWTALAPAGIAAAAASRTLALPEALALPLTLAAAGGATALPLLERTWAQRAVRRAHDISHSRATNHHHHQHEQDEQDDHDHINDHALQLQISYPPSYAPKLLALATAALAPVAALNVSSESDGGSGLLRIVYPAAAAATLAALTSDGQYLLRIESYRGFGLDWFLPLAGAVLQAPDGRTRLAGIAALGAAWLAARQRGAGDLLTTVDAPHPMGHTHHISAAARLAGDLGIWLGPRPARKWAGAAAVALAASNVLGRRGRRDAAAIGAAGGALGYALTLSAFRQPQRHLALTARGAAPGFALGAALGAILELAAP